MKKLLLSIFVLLIGFSNSFATHNRAGEITYRYIGTGALPYNYEITVKTYTEWVGPSGTDKCELNVHFGDGDTAIVPRVNGSSFNCPSSADGVLLLPDTRYNVYVTTHNYDGPGNYIITMEDPNRNGGICNIPDSDNKSFFLRSELVISPFLGQNTSPILLNKPLDDACIGE